MADAVATQDTVTQLVSAIRRVGREVPGGSEQIAALCTGHDYPRPGKPKIDWDDSEGRRDGYRAHVAADPGTGIITDEKLTRAAAAENPDAAVAAEFVAAEAEGGGTSSAAGRDGDRGDGGGQLTWYADSAYGTGDLRAAIAGAGHHAVIKPGPLLPAVDGGFTTDDFTADTAARTVICPVGVTRHLTARNAVIFGAACRGCPLRQQCTTAKAGRTLHLHEHDSLLRAARAAGPGLRQDYSTHRSHVERSSPRSPPGEGAASSSATANHAWLKRRTAALNPRNLLGKGLIRCDGSWTLAT